MKICKLVNFPAIIPNIYVYKIIYSRQNNTFVKNNKNKNEIRQKRKTFHVNPKLTVRNVHIYTKEKSPKMLLNSIFIFMFATLELLGGKCI